MKSAPEGRSLRGCDMEPAMLYGWWPMHRTFGDAIDLSGNDLHGSVSGPTRGVTGRGGITAFDFDGTDDTVSVSLNTPPESAYTACAWVRHDNTSGDQAYIDQTGNVLYLDNGSDLTIYTTSKLAAYTYNPSVGTWYHIGYTGDSSGSELYIDGQQVLSNSNSFSADNKPNSALGSRRDSQSYTAGRLCDVRIYDRKLSSAEFEQLYRWGIQDDGLLQQVVNV